MDNKQQDYWNQVWCSQHTHQVISMVGALQEPDDKCNVPYPELHSPFSRFVVTLIDKSGTSTTILKGNIRHDEVADIIERYRAVYAASITASLRAPVIPKESEGGDKKSSSGGSMSTVRLTMGKFAGKTPAEVLRENGENLAELLKHRDFLQLNIAKYPNNQRPIDAITEAENAFMLGELDLEGDDEQQEVSVTTGGSIPIFEERFKIQSGGSEHAAVVITYEPQMKNHWKFFIENAEITATANKNNPSAWKNKKSASIVLNDKEMANFISALERNKILFENMIFREMREKSLASKWKPSPEG